MRPDAGRAAKPPRGGLRVVLLSPHRGANVGAACRAIRNMGAGDLAVVGGDYDPDEARRTAVHAADTFDSRIQAESLEDAVASCSFVIGTSSRKEPWQIPAVPIAVALGEARRRGLRASEIALVFGPEDRGLSNDELARCHRVAFVPTAGDYSSLNLAQAVVVCLYEWLRGGTAEATAAAAPPAPAEAQAAAVADIESVLAEIGFLEGDQAGRVMASVASMLLRGGLSERDVAILRGIARQIRWAARQPQAKPSRPDPG